MPLAMHLMRFSGRGLLLLGAVGVIASAPLGPFYLLLGLSLLAGGWTKA
ncbi:MAG: hypothetical protein WD382_02455 [Halofilum sp. (in: g-proteobacteria)]